MRGIPRTASGVREIAQTILVFALIGAFFATQSTTDGLREKAVSADKSAKTATDAAVVNAAGIEKIGLLLKDACKVAPDKDLAEEGLLKECNLAQQDRLDEVVPAEVPSSDDPSSKALNAYVDARVDRYLSTYKPKIAGVTDEELKTRVRALLLTDPAFTGPKGDKGDSAPAITDAQVSQAVAAILAAKPPKAIRSTSFDSDGCNLTISYTDGTSDTFGSLCGEKGDEGPRGGDGPQGTPGPPGEPGAPGKDGRGIESIKCVPASETSPVPHLQVEYTDGGTEPITIENATCIPSTD